MAPVARGSIPGDNQDFSFFSFAFSRPLLVRKFLSSSYEGSELDNLRVSSWFFRSYEGSLVTDSWALLHRLFEHKPLGTYSGKIQLFRF